MRPSLSAAAKRDKSSRRAVPQEERGDGARRMSDVWRWLGMSGDALGTTGVARRTLIYGYAVVAVPAGAINIVDVITTRHDEPQYGLAAPILWEGSSWLTLILFLWIPWIAYRIAPLAVRPALEAFCPYPGRAALLAGPRDGLCGFAQAGLLDRRRAL